MEKHNEKAVQELNNLIECSKGGQEAYTAAVQNVKSPNIKSLFTDLGKQHLQFAKELENQVKTLGGTPVATSEGRLQTGAWKGAKSAIAVGNEKEVLEKFEITESEIEARYGHVLKEVALPTDVKEIVRKQHENQRNFHNQILDMQKTVK